MVANIVNYFSKAITTRTVQQNTPVKGISSNPFANPFVSSQGTSGYSSYAKNNPVRGGYFAGYINGRANIVGQRLFVEA